MVEEQAPDPETEPIDLQVPLNLAPDPPPSASTVDVRCCNYVMETLCEARGEPTSRGSRRRQVPKM